MFDENLKELIVEAKEKLGERAAEIIRKELKIENWDKDTLKGSCPLGHTDETPSFIWNPKNNSFHCFSCGNNFGIIDLYLKDGLTYIEAVAKLFNLDEVKTKYRFSEKGIKTERKYIYPAREQNSDRTKVEEYLGLRCISKETLDRIDIQQDSNENVVFHYYDTNDVVCMVKYRPTHVIKKGESKNWCQKGASTKPLLFNMNRVDTSNGPLLINEGEIDSLAAIEAGYTNTVSVPMGAGNFGWIEENWDWLELFDKIIIWSDTDEAGFKMRKEVCSRLGVWRTLYVDAPSIVKDKDGQDVKVKDVNEILYHCGKQFVLDLIFNAQEIPIEGISDLADTEEFDIEKAPGLYSRLKPIDDIVYKFVFGSVVLVTGKRGSGKSVFINQVFACEPLNQGHDVFYFSGELISPVLKNWIELAMAGSEKIKMKNKFVHVIDSDARKEMRKWYKGRIWVYSENNNNSDYILEKAIATTRKYGVKVWLLDNLMTLDIGSNGSDIYQRQKDFIVKLNSLALIYGVLIVLVTHPKKIGHGFELEADDVSGASEITNLAQCLVSVKRFSKKDKAGEADGKGGYKKGKDPIDEDVEVSILKNRYTGDEDVKRLYFDYPSYRFYSSLEELYKRYKWNEDESPLPTKDPRLDSLPNFMKEKNE